ncbi:MAG: ATP-grasp domain-containing protein [Ilumatobacteraceae bacterium]
MTTTVLISSAGRRVELLDAFRSALRDLDVDGRVVAADASWWSAARHRADDAFDVPRCDDPSYVDRFVELCERERVDLVVPTIDPELPVLAAARDRLAGVGTTVAVSSPATVAIAADKVATHRWLIGAGLPTVRQGTPDDVAADPAAWPYPLVVKPRAGSAGRGVVVAAGPSSLEVAASQGDVVVEELAAGAEHTIDVFVDRAGGCVCAVPRRRVEVRAGEVAKAVTVRSPALQDLAASMVAALPGPFGVLTFQVFVGADPDELAVIELNARFGGGFPLTRQAGADYPRWMLEELLGRPSTARPDGWQHGLVMLRYDAAVFVPQPDGEVRP